jgi:hypothetical protein
MPAIGHFVPLFAASREGQAVELSDWLQALTQAVPMLDDADSDYVMDSALRMVRFKTGGDRWANLFATNGGGIMFEPADVLDTQLMLVFEVLRESLQGFSFDKLLGVTNSDTSTPMPTGIMESRSSI